MKPMEIVKKVEKSLRDNSPAVLTALGVSGTITTAYLSGKASYEVGYYEGKNQRNPTTKQRLQQNWRKYIPTAISGATTITAIIIATRVSTKRTAAAYSLLSISEHALNEYRDKVVETIGVRKEQTVRDGIAQDRVTNNPPESREVIVTPGGSVLCMEMHTGRYFNSDMETLRKAENQINARIHREMYANLSDFYSLIKIPYTSDSDNMGWDTDRLMELKFSTVLSPDGRPCISFDYNYLKPL